MTKPKKIGIVLLTAGAVLVIAAVLGALVSVKLALDLYDEKIRRCYIRAN